MDTHARTTPTSKSKNNAEIKGRYKNAKTHNATKAIHDKIK